MVCLGFRVHIVLWLTFIFLMNCLFPKKELPYLNLSILFQLCNFSLDSKNTWWEIDDVAWWSMWWDQHGCERGRERERARENQMGRERYVLGGERKSVNKGWGFFLAKKECVMILFVFLFYIYNFYCENLIYKKTSLWGSSIFIFLGKKLIICIHYNLRLLNFPITKIPRGVTSIMRGERLIILIFGTNS